MRSRFCRKGHHKRGKPICAICRKAFYARFRTRKNSVERKRRAERQRLAFDFLGGKCLDCGNRDPRVLEFDHVKKKNFVIASSLMLTWSKLVKELRKCELVCANCHRIRTRARIPEPPPDQYVYVRRQQIVANGLALTCKEWAERLGVSYHTLNNRRKSGWSHNDIINTPIKKGPRR